MALLIDPPVSSFSPPDAIEAWIAHLQAMRLDYIGSPDDVADIDFAIEQAEEALQFRRKLVKTPLGGYTLPNDEVDTT